MEALGAPVIGPAGALLNTSFDWLSPGSLTAYVKAVAAQEFRCFGLPTDVAHWLPPPQQETRKRRIQAHQLRPRQGPAPWTSPR